MGFMEYDTDIDRYTRRILEDLHEKLVFLEEFYVQAVAKHWLLSAVFFGMFFGFEDFEAYCLFDMIITTGERLCLPCFVWLLEIFVSMPGQS